MRVLVIYDRGTTFTNAVYDHLQAFAKYSRHTVRFGDYSDVATGETSLLGFDAIVHHFSVRLTRGLPPELVEREAAFAGQKLLFIQDEYESTNIATRNIQDIGYDVVFTCVPIDRLSQVYPGVDRSRTQFVQVLTGYAQAEVPDIRDVSPPSSKSILIGYRGRPLSLKYGELGILKREFARRVENAAKTLELSTDISYLERRRLYGSAWTDFLGSVSVTLGTPSGSNVFDTDGTLDARIGVLRDSGKSDIEIYDGLIRPLEIPGLMNQVSPRVFEALASGNALLMTRDAYSGVLEADVHYVPIDNDFGNLEAQLERLTDGRLIDRVWRDAYRDVIASGRYSYRSFIQAFDDILSASPVAPPAMFLEPSVNSTTPAPQRPEVDRSITRRLRRALSELRDDADDERRTIRAAQRALRKLSRLKTASRRSKGPNLGDVR